MDSSRAMGFPSYRLSILWCLALFLLLLALLSSPMVVADLHPAWLAETREGNSPLVAPPQVVDEPMMVVSKDGGLHALDPVSKKKRWSFSSGDALCSTYSSHFADGRGGHDLTGREWNGSMDYGSGSSENDEDDDPSAESCSIEDEDLSGYDDDDLHSRDGGARAENPGDWSIFLGPNGALYVQDVGGVNKLPVTVEQLVERSPYHTDQGTVLLSSVTNTAFLLNRDNGALIRKFDNSGSTLLKKAASSHSTGVSGVNADDAELLLSSDPGKNASVDDNVPTILCVRTDYLVSVHEVATGIVHWNISFGDIKILSKMAPGYHNQQTIAGQRNVGGSGKELIPTFGHPHSSRIVQQKLQPAPIAIFSSSGEFVNHLLPEFQEGSSSHGKQVPALPIPRDYKTSAKITDLHHNITSPILAQADHQGLVPVLVRIGESKQISQTVENDKFYTEGDRPNSSRAHGNSLDFSYSSTISLVLLIVLAVLIFFGVILAIINLAMLVYKELRTKKENDNSNYNKEKKVGGGGNKRKKARKGSNLMKGSSGEDLHEDGSPKHQDGAENGLDSHVDGARNLGKRWQWMDTAAYGDGIQVGRLFVTKVTIGAGSNGTTVFEGYLDGRKVAVKRLLAHYYEKAEKEIALLIASDEHPNVVRYYAMEETPDFIYVALERCSLSLNDLILSQSAQSPFQNEKRDGVNLTEEKQLKLASGKQVKLWDECGHPSLQLLQLMRDVASGLAHLHSLGIVHRDLKPQNVLVSNGRILQAKLADMGLSKHLANDDSSFQATGPGGSGSRGWQAPEQLLDGRQTRAVDMFTLGCVLFFCITGGQHPFGEHYHRDYNIANGKADLFCIEDMPDVHHLIQALLNHDASKRPVARDVVLHPLFWNSDERLSFLRDASDRVELEDREDNSAVLAAVEAVGPKALGGTWDVHLDPDLLENLRRYRRYNFNSVRDLLRVIRNKSNHYRELPQNVQDLLGPVPEGYESYFRARFPRLLIEVYKVLIDHCKEERMFRRYFAGSQS